MDEFNRTHKDVHVTFTEIPSGPPAYQKLFDAIKTGNGPDLFNCGYMYLPQFASQGDVQDISQYITGDLKSKFVPSGTASSWCW
ncbi:extracellular solute-binding protein [Streptomyces sp. RB6PN25]|uniref:Extracellular solute-binding protein n=1 Tax=Streptomyces humicola TaxID=2953240 RepID=A0ABT1Q886_9ACTN|nr:extracellular solute-binding protein [Streptomyces humicola]MCQ4084997.1 extracellular solute-binding protein [Streptomyces humicola]